MGRLLVTLGILCIFLAVAYMIAMLFGVNHPTLQPIIGSLICEPYETLSVSQTQTVDGTSMRFNCIGTEDEVRDAMIPAVLWIGGGFTVILMVGIILSSVGGNIIRRRAIARFHGALSDAMTTVYRATGNTHRN